MKFDVLKTEYLSECEVRLLANDKPLLELVKEQEILLTRHSVGTAKPLTKFSWSFRLNRYMSKGISS
ncbi:hypothetical protein MNBD_GAMMA12-2266 [hydrothermal vent metagenome]|uniref:Uncharacterized protein n=1 Tax=hydrothermal vent metagenome TaxID=652676 RepID=A0A3B0YMT3_9ZZZZ